ncbi:MAG: inositol monophosphatase family protein [Acidithiobacillus sp.]|jgi:myo-inositol-1(or 4)-monophosphatase|uniref:inositol monophosphatase family protein n=1 Tax=Acidithiobacillus sp. TaxID=1872118 RepID=UPI0025C35959|nr:inositol monophosphatase family protein [Acidithiobacillus sp.]
MFTSSESDMAWIGGILRQAAERFILPRFHEVVCSRKPDGSVVTSADLDSQDFLQAMLASRYPELPLLGEEMTRPQQERLLARDVPLWCLDPLDGTSNFAAGVPIFGISLALLQGGQAIAGWVYDPIRDELFTARAGHGATLNGQALMPREAPSLDKAVGVVDYKRLTRALSLRLIDERPFHSQRNFGSSVLEWCWLAAGRYHFYLHGGQQLWDRAAGALILTETGGSLSTLVGAPLPVADLACSSVLATLDPLLHAAWRRWLGDDRPAPCAEFPKREH